MLMSSISTLAYSCFLVAQHFAPYNRVGLVGKSSWDVGSGTKVIQLYVHRFNQETMQSCISIKI